MDAYKKFALYCGEFFEKTIDSENFEAVVFPALQKILPYDTACIFFINQDNLRLKYKIKKAVLPEELTPEEFMVKFDNSKYLVSDLKIENYPYAKLVIGNSREYNEEEALVFKSVSRIISGLVKDTEISSVLKMQVELLQNGMYELSKANKTIREQNKKIAQTNKVKSEFFANTSHQLRSPLNSIIGYADLLSSEFSGNLNEKQKTYVNDIKIAGINLLEMVNEILDMTKLESGSMQLYKTNFSIKNNITEVLNILYPLYKEKNITVTLNADRPIEISADYQKLQQVFFNIISNAIKFTPENGLIEISAENNGKYIKISIKDNGIGISEENQKKIFKKFVQINPSSTASTGLGLTIAKEIIKLHSGKISLKSSPGKGSEFMISIPKS